MKRVLKILSFAFLLSAVLCLKSAAVGAEHKHSYVLYLSESPTCTDKGITVYSCELCGDTYSVYVDALEHDFKLRWEVDFEPTCEKAGQKSRHCTRCNAITDILEIKKLNHSMTVTTVAPTCILNGYDLHKCSVCGFEMQTDFKQPNGHTLSLWIIDNQPDCENAGLRHIYCTVCGVTLQIEPISPHGHSYQVTVIEPTCTEKGCSVHTCRICEKSYTDKETKALGHDFSENGRITEYPTCTVKGSQVCTCKRCNVTEVQPVAALGHDFSSEWTVDVPATCTAYGERSHHCTRCSTRKDVVKTEKLGHTEVKDEAVAPSCTQSGLAEGSHCSVCGKVIVARKTVSALGHDFKLTARLTEPTCTSAGADETRCTRCGETKTQTVAKLGHDYPAEWTVEAKPTCTSAGSSKCVCKRCGNTKTQSISKLGHNYSTEWFIDRSPTCTAMGEKSRHCLRCSARTDVISVERASHTEVTDKAVAATCTKSGKTQGSHCKVCGKVLTPQTKTEPTGHKNVTSLTKATAKKDGKLNVKCKNCGEIFSNEKIYKIASVALSKTSFTYDAKAHKPSVTVKDSRDKKLKNKTDYTLKYQSGRKAVGEYTVTVTFKGNYSGTKTLTFKVLPKSPAGISCTQTASRITLTWKKVSGADGYCIYEYNSKTKKYTSLGKTDGLSYTVKKLGGAEKHSYALKAYKTVNSKKIYSNYSALKKTATKPCKPELSLSSGAGFVKLKWNNVGSCEYEIYRSEKRNGKYICIGTTGKTTFTDKNVVRNKSYCYKVKACVKSSTSTLSTVSSEIKNTKVK